MKIEDLINEEQIILTSLTNNRKQQREFYINEFILQNKINVGDVVETNTKFFSKAKVIEFVYLFDEKIHYLSKYPEVKPCGIRLANLRIDGKLGAKEITLYTDYNDLKIRPLKIDI